jgi:hypothetical protein
MINRPNLFHNEVPDALRGSQQHFTNGFDVLSAYALQELPTDLSAVRTGAMTYDELAQKQHGVVQDSYMTTTSNRDPQAAQVAQMDMLFMLGGYLPKGKESFDKVPNSLRAMLDYNTNRFNLPSHMDYETIVDVNSDTFQRTGNIRVFSEGDLADAERDFYLSHYYTEPYVKVAAFTLRSLVENPDSANKSEALASARDHLAEFAGALREYRHLAKEEFSHFRQYLTSYPDGVRNASGAFMPSPQLVELALHQPMPQFELFLAEATPYYPGWARPLIEQWKEDSKQGDNIKDALFAGRLDLDEEQRLLLTQVVTEFYNFKQAHLGVTVHQVPEAFPPNPDDRCLGKGDLKDFGERNIFESKQVRGTGGFDVQNLLGSGVWRMLNLLGELQTAPAAKPRADSTIGQTANPKRSTL